jgi:hypothetical protein
MDTESLARGGHVTLPLLHVAVLLTEAPTWETVGLEMMLSMVGPKTMPGI